MPPTDPTLTPGTLLAYAPQLRARLATEGHHDDEPVSSDDDEKEREKEKDGHVRFPLTPPPSEHAGSRPISPLDSTTHTIHLADAQGPPLTLCLTSRRAAKPAIAAAAQVLRATGRTKGRRRGKGVPPPLTVDDLDALLECTLSWLPMLNTSVNINAFYPAADHGLSSPDFMIVHAPGAAPTELHGYSPWHIRLTEI